MAEEVSSSTYVTPPDGSSGPVSAFGGECGARDAATAPGASGGHTADPGATVPVPVDTLRRLVRVAAHVSLGRSAAYIAPYPDATARRALGELDDAGLLDQLGENPDQRLNPNGETR